MIDTLGIVDDKAPGSPRNFRRRNLPPLNTQRSSPVPFLKEKPGITEPLGRQFGVPEYVSMWKGWVMATDGGDNSNVITQDLIYWFTYEE